MRRSSLRCSSALMGRVRAVSTRRSISCGSGRRTAQAPARALSDLPTVEGAHVLRIPRAAPRPNERGCGHPRTRGDTGQVSSRPLPGGWASRVFAQKGRASGPARGCPCLSRQAGSRGPRCGHRCHRAPEPSLLHRSGALWWHDLGRRGGNLRSQPVISGCQDDDEEARVGEFSVLRSQIVTLEKGTRGPCRRPR